MITFTIKYKDHHTNIVLLYAIILVLCSGEQPVSSTYITYEKALEQDIPGWEFQEQKRSRQVILEDEEFEYKPLCHTVKTIIQLPSDEHYEYFPESYMNITCLNTQSDLNFMNTQQMCEIPGFHCVQTSHRLPIIRFKRNSPGFGADKEVDLIEQQVYDCECKHLLKRSWDKCMRKINAVK